jgi:hypothetical protein
MPAAHPDLIDLTVTRKKFLPTGCWIALGVAGGVFLLGLLAVGGIVWVGLAGMQGPRNVNLTVNHPYTVAPGDSFQIEILIENTDTDSQSLDSIDIYNDYLRGVRILSSDPPYSESSNLFGITSYWYDRDIRPGQTLRVVLSAQALQTGFYTADIDVCINNPYTYATYVIQTEVTTESDTGSDTPPLPSPTFDPDATPAPDPDLVSPSLPAP